MDIIGAMDAQNRIMFTRCGFYIYIYIYWYMLRKRSKAHQHILYISQNIERRNLIAIFFFFFFGGGGTLGGWSSLRRFIHFYLRKKNIIQNSVERIWVTVIQVLS